MDKGSILKDRVLGIDCGTAIVGWAIVDKEFNKLTHVNSGAIRTDKNDVMYLRLEQIFQEINKIIKEYNPTVMAIEDIFYFKNQKTVISVSQSRGVTMLSGTLNKLEIYNYTPLQVKSAVTGYGRAEKKQVAFMIGKILKLSNIPTLDDITDAIAVGICHLNSNNVR